MPKAIQTKYLPATDTKGSRVKAFDCDNNSVTIGYDSALNSEDVHRKAALALIKKMGWSGEIKGGWLKKGMAFVFVD
jgi:hypothetical protein